MPLGVSPNGNDFLPSGDVTSATTKFQLPTIWSLRLFDGCAAAAPADSATASMATAMILGFMVSSPGNVLSRMLARNASQRDAPSGSGQHQSVPRMQRIAISAFTRVFDARCGALLNPGSTTGAPAWVPALRCTVKNAAPRPGHGVYDFARNAPGATKQPGGQISAYPVGQISALAPPVSPDERGGSRSSRTRGGMRWTRKLRLTSVTRADGEAVWS